jgi:S1-C subfamily serine protease
MNTRWIRTASVVGAMIVLGAPQPSLAQRRGDDGNAAAPLIVEGTVRQTYRSAGQEPTESLLEIAVSRSEARSSGQSAAQARFPAPGESLYVHIAGRPDSAGRVLLQGNGKELPGIGSRITAYLKPRERGGWEGATADWFEPAGSGPPGINPEDLAREALEKVNAPSSLGMTTELLRIDTRHVLRVTSVERGGPAQAAGLEVGDVIAAAGGKEISSANQLAELAAKGDKIPLVVVDVNTGRGARIEIDPRAEAASTTTADSSPAPQPPRVSLGLSAEPVTLGTRSALKVIRVDPSGPAAKAGLEPGDILVAANGAPTTGVEQLLSALRKSGPTFKLTVRDSRTRRDVDVDVNLGTTAATPAEVEAPIKASPGKLGAVTELAFHDNDFAVKVTEVEPGSAAARAGLRPGSLIVAAGGKPVLHPNDLNDAVRTSNGALKLTIVDPSTGKKSDLNLSLR